MTGPENMGPDVCPPPPLKWLHPSLLVTMGLFNPILALLNFHGPQEQVESGPHTRTPWETGQPCALAG